MTDRERERERQTDRETEREIDTHTESWSQFRTMLPKSNSQPLPA